MRRSLLMLPLLATLACRSDATGPRSIADERDLRFLHPLATAPALAATSASFYARRGEERSVSLFYRPAPGAVDSVRFLQFTVPAAALASRPDGSPLSAGDSVLITVTVTDPSRLIVSFEPSGLRFSASRPAHLSLSVGEASESENSDHAVDVNDPAVRAQLSFWRQEHRGDPWTRVTGSMLVPDLEEMEADIGGFTGYAIAY